ncbi:hypothetical protein GCK72_007489 [Caenorhabditis remanei]|uniref:RBR-type E3 ubiquitin transferase n=1 Tax=Caenorhabditis remanei TaxID=31234 RepID=A0A6A5HHF9_CAERE|nr:hypothetical protein GCK72_007489 [Caenorhabditis remanei]KAF1767530.1 hypothetical protein GCK72_007489 [Caenorhabditis remanei]
MSSDDDMYDDDSFEQETVDDQILDREGLKSDMEEVITSVQETIQVTEGVCRILLQNHKWNQEALIDKFYDSADLETFLSAANIPLQTPSSADGECDICCDMAPLTGLSCAHLACSQCWKAYITEKIKEGQSEIECMAPKCQLIIPDEQVVKCISDDTKVLDTYHRVILNNYVKTNVYLEWCPGIDCGKAVKGSTCDPHLIVCTCGTRFCFACSNDWHEPVDCRQMKLWVKKCGESSETATWIIENTKDCPKCLTSIQKNGGCNYIRCTNPKCGYQFCWICMNAWSVHANAWYNCNSFDQAAENNRSQFRNNHDRYLFFYNRYRSHEQSLKMEERLIAKMNMKMEQMQNHSMTWREVQFLREAVNVLSLARRTMMFTYVFAYFLQKNNHSMMFETNQKDMEMATEQLSGFLEQDLEGENLKTLKLKVQDKCRYVEQRRNALLNHCKEGIEQDVWEFIE